MVEFSYTTKRGDKGRKGRRKEGRKERRKEGRKEGGRGREREGGRKGGRGEREEGVGGIKEKGEGGTTWRRLMKRLWGEVGGKERMIFIYLFLINLSAFHTLWMFLMLPLDD